MIKKIYQDLNFLRGLTKEEAMEIAFIVKCSFDYDSKIYRRFVKLYDKQLEDELTDLEYQHMLKLVIVLTLRGEM